MYTSRSKSKVMAIGFSLAMLIVYFVNSILVAIVYGILLGTGTIGDGLGVENYMENNFVSFLTTLSIVVSIVYGIILYCKQRSSRKYLDRPFVSLNAKVGKGDFIESLILFIGTFGVTILWVLLVNILSEGKPIFERLLESHNDTMGGLTNSESFLLIFATLVVIAPITEELLFRGLIYGRLRQAMKPATSILISSLIFGIFHGNVVQGVYAFFIGCILALVYERTDSLLLAIFGHAFVNAVGIIPSYLGLRGLNIVLIILGCIAIIPSIKILRKWLVESRDLESAEI